jgi:hypothetical protein
MLTADCSCTAAGPSQVGAGGGMKGGVNIWRALRDTDYVHPCWLHCAGRPYK